MRAALLIAVMCMAHSVLADYSLTATVDRTTISVGETITYTITFDGAATGVPTPEPPNMSLFRVAAGPYTETKFEIINMRRSSKYSCSYVLMATGPGTGTIGRATVTYKGRQYQSEPLSIQITRAGAASEGTPKDDVFIRVYADKTEAYPGEQITLTYKIFFAVQITNPEITQLPRATGFWTEEFDIPQQMPLRDEVIGGRSYKSGIFRKVAVFPTTSGDLTVQPMTIRTKVEVQDRRRSRAADPFFRFSRTMENREIGSPPITLRIKPLPEADQPANFDGAVGKFTVLANLDRTACEAHDAVTLTVVVRGEGNIKTLPEPRIQIPPDFETYEPKSSENIQRNRAIINGTKQFEYVLIPRVSGSQVIPAIRYVYFNPSSGQYVTASTQPLTLQVSKPKESVAGEVSLPMGRKRGVENIASDIAFVKTSPGAFYTGSGQPHATFTFWLFTVSPWLALAAFALVYRRSSRFETGRISLRRATAMAMKELAAAEKALASGAVEDAYRRVALALQTTLSTKLECDPGSLTSETLADLWHQRGLDESMLDSTLRLMRECDRSRFAAGVLERADAEKLIHDARGIVTKLEALGQGRGT